MNITLDASALDQRHFSRAQLDAFFDAILINDEVDAETPLPEAVAFDFEPILLIDCYRLSRQLWKEGVDRRAMIALTAKLRRDRDLGPEDRLAFKYARAKIKQVRFACALFGAHHSYPTILDWMTTALGHLQDAFKTGQRAAVWREALLCRLFLARGPYALLRRGIDRLRPATSAGFRAYLFDQIDGLRDILARGTLTGAQFHAARKVISRQIAFYTALDVIQPSERNHRMTRLLAAINGRMGRMHDELVDRREAGTLDYHGHHFDLPDDIRARLTALVSLYPAGPAS
ncbi:MAG TPA: hypothetical protein VK533_17185 [Sphingomonas sp.]|uniref:hypothetical protein n=1 Tax=Sphingomonas sp. TaxID=28214 RepID=UPI002D15978E|nr:hypothetical protein [Sphingomonas sp.]HMI21269.1 hypothetical protein [Sphingomonas sp.]